jgi:hypothetical protein
MVVGGDQWEEKNNPVVKKWISRDYKSIQMESGRNAEQRKKQKMKQRFFYAYLEAPRETKQIRFKHCLATFRTWAPLSPAERSSITQAHINVSFPYFPFSCMP